MPNPGAAELHLEVKDASVAEIKTLVRWHDPRQDLLVQCQ